MHKEVPAKERGMPVHQLTRDPPSNHPEIDRLPDSNPQGEVMPALQEVTGQAQVSFLQMEEVPVPVEVTVPAQASFLQRVAIARQEATGAIAGTLTLTTATM